MATVGIATQQSELVTTASFPLQVLLTPLAGGGGLHLANSQPLDIITREQ